MKGPAFINAFCEAMNSLIVRKGGTLYVAGSPISINHIYQILWYRYVRSTLNEEFQNVEYGTLDKDNKDLVHTQKPLVLEWLRLNHFEVLSATIYDTYVELGDDGEYRYINRSGTSPIDFLNNAFKDPIRKSTLIIENDPFAKQDVDFSKSISHYKKLGVTPVVIEYH